MVQYAFSLLSFKSTWQFFSSAAMRMPFEVRFVSDNFEFVNEAAKAQKGFRLLYNLVPCPMMTDDTG